MIEDSNLIDPDRTVCLCDAGQPGYLAATAVAADGTEHLVLADLGALGDAAAVYDPDCVDVAHEQLGPLPARWRHRTALAPLRCARRTKAGTPCRIPVTSPGDACGWHRAPAADTAAGRQAAP